MIPSSRTDVAIVGAGPYGLSIAAHLRAAGVDFRIFGTPMLTWRSNMPRGMFLKSEGCASNLFDAAGSFSLKRFCADEGARYGDYNVPVSLETFTQYALAFQQRFVPAVEDVAVTSVENRSAHFELRTSTGETLQARSVVIATGVSHAAYVPPELAGLPPDLVSHSSRHYDLGRFAGRSVTVIGAGQSALETAALLREAGAEVLLLARRSTLQWNGYPSSGRRSLYQRLRRPMSHLGPGLGPWLYCTAPNLFRYLPRRVRIARVKNTLGPAGAWWLKERVDGLLPSLLGCSLKTAETRGDRVRLQVQGSDGACRELTTDHVIAATGYRFTLASQRFLGAGLQAQVRTEGQTPILSASFESSVPGLYFTGLASANQFGPAMRFLHGAAFTARRVSRHVAARVGRLPGSEPVSEPQRSGSGSVLTAP